MALMARSKNTSKRTAILCMAGGLVLAAMLKAPGTSVAAQEADVTIFYNGEILTMEGDTPAYVDAVAIQDGKIAFVGSKSQALAEFAGAKVVDLKGRTMLPGFVDGWGHFTLLAQQALGVDLSYFGTNPKSRAELVQRLKETKPFNGWITGHGYSAAFLRDGAPTLEDLDTAFPDTPVLIADMSTNTGMVNSAGLRDLGFTPETPALQPGEIVKDPKTGKLTGALIFMPFKQAFAKAFGAYPREVVFQTYRDAEAKLARQGYTTVQTYQLATQDVQNLRAAFDAGELAIDVMAIVDDITYGESFLQKPDWQWGSYSHSDRGLKVCGMLVSVDTAPQLRLARFTQPYQDTRGFPDGFQGTFVRPVADIERLVRHAYQNDIQLFGYAAGDGGIDLMLDAIAKAVAATGKTEDRRTVISHSTFVRPDQLERYQAQNVIAAMWPINAWMYGDTYVEILGPERANAAMPVATAFAKGVVVATHTDYPSAGPSVLENVWSGATRKTVSGLVLGGPEMKADPYRLLQAHTRNTAFMYREEKAKGTITVGKVADFVVLDINPLKVALDEIRSIQVTETIKRGKTIYLRQP
jgi:predicted amidohydrolase YtcJ